MTIDTRAMGSGVVEVSLYGVIGGDPMFGGGGLTARDIESAIAAMPGAETIKLRINSPGGDAIEGVAMYDVLHQSGKNVEVTVQGQAASAASIIAMAGDDISITSGSRMMIHNAWTIAAGDATEMRKVADVLERHSAGMANIYSARCGMTVEKVREMMSDETWMSATEAVDYGFADRVIAAKRKKAEPDDDDDDDMKVAAFAARVLPWSAAPAINRRASAPTQPRSAIGAIHNICRRLS